MQPITLAVSFATWPWSLVIVLFSLGEPYSLWLSMSYSSSIVYRFPTSISTRIHKRNWNHILWQMLPNTLQLLGVVVVVVVTLILRCYYLVVVSLKLPFRCPLVWVGGWRNNLSLSRIRVLFSILPLLLLHLLCYCLVIPASGIYFRNQLLSWLDFWVICGCWTPAPPLIDLGDLFHPLLLLLVLLLPGRLAP